MTYNGPIARCPVCRSKYLKHALRGHINGAARMEVYRWFTRGRKLPIPHQKYIDGHSIANPRKIIEII